MVKKVFVNLNYQTKTIRQMKNLSERNKELILHGANVTGTFVEAYQYVEESLYIDDADDVREFCTWLDNEIGGASRYNIDILWLAYKNPENLEYTNEAKIIADKIKRIKSLIG